MTIMIPKKIYYCWFGGNKKNHTILKCIDSWKRHCPEYSIIEINEENFDIHQNSFCQKAYLDKKWAFVSDYARLKIINENGGIYMDTDMELIKNIDIFLKNDFFSCFEKNDTIINFAIFGSIKGNFYNKKMLEKYNSLSYYETIPNIGTNVYNNLNHKEKKKLMILDKEYFYPFDFDSKFSKKCITKNTYGIHWWETNWFPWYYKIIKKVGLLWIVPILGKFKNKIFKK